MNSTKNEVIVEDEHETFACQAHTFIPFSRVGLEHYNFLVHWGRASTNQRILGPVADECEGIFDKRPPRAFETERQQAKLNALVCAFQANWYAHTSATRISIMLMCKKYPFYASKMPISTAGA